MDKHRKARGILRAVPTKVDQFENVNFGFNGSKIWVDRGCRADFRFTYTIRRENAPNALLTVDSIDGELQQYGIAWRRCVVEPEPIFIECHSGQMRYAECDTRQPIARVEVDHRYSVSRCDEGRSFGISGSKIWVNLGCRARFKVYPAP